MTKHQGENIYFLITTICSVPLQTICYNQRDHFNKMISINNRNGFASVLDLHNCYIKIFPLNEIFTFKVLCIL